MKNLVIIAASVALIAGGCGKKDKVEDAAGKVAEKVETTADAAAKKAGDMKDKVAEKVDGAKESYGSDSEKEAAKESYGSDSGHMEGKLSDADRKMMTDKCLDEETISAEGCACTVKVMESGLSEDTLGVFLTASKLDQEKGAGAGDAYLQANMTDTRGMEFFGIMPKLVDCDPAWAEQFGQ